VQSAGGWIAVPDGGEGVDPGAMLGASVGSGDKSGSSLELGLTASGVSTALPPGSREAIAGDELLGAPHAATTAIHRATAAPWRVWRGRAAGANRSRVTGGG